MYGTDERWKTEWSHVLNRSENMRKQQTKDYLKKCLEKCWESTVISSSYPSLSLLTSNSEAPWKGYPQPENSDSEVAVSSEGVLDASSVEVHEIAKPSRRNFDMLDVFIIFFLVVPVISPFMVHFHVWVGLRFATFNIVLRCIRWCQRFVASRWRKCCSLGEYLWLVEEKRARKSRCSRNKQELRQMHRKLVFRLLVRDQCSDEACSAY